ncbi:MAG TPA: polysaccharide biosynthesis/export family protein [Candidatus Ozemobacteraceae bacterium]|nr:polysaccharide biosynthesis/export family protein [Candidatus Ozemobacteraceae bacterium]
MHKRYFISLLFAVLFLAASQASAQETLAPGDRIRVWVKGEPDLTVERVIGSDGSIAYPLIGNVGMNGLKPHEAARVIARMLDDGYIRQPLVQVDVTSRAAVRPEAARVQPEEAGEVTSSEASSAGAGAPTVIEVVDGKTGEGIGNAALLLGGKIYQSNRLGQIVAEALTGRIVLLADGYKILQGPADRFVRTGNPARIIMDRITLAREITVKVIDADTKKPLPGALVKLDEMSVKTNGQGIFKVKDIRKEFGEIRLEMAGYKPLRRVLDFKGPAEQVLALKRHE